MPVPLRLCRLLLVSISELMNNDKSNGNMMTQYVFAAAAIEVLSNAHVSHQACSPYFSSGRHSMLPTAALILFRVFFNDLVPSIASPSAQPSHLHPAAL